MIVAMNSNDHDNKKQSVAKRRWQLLIEVITQQRTQIRPEESITRRFSSFGLLKVFFDYDDELDPEIKWYRYTCDYFPDFSMNIRHVNPSFNIDTILGFNNTGNVCVWPAEEVLTYYVLKNRDIAIGKNICEIGGGMTCLSGIATAINCNAKSVLLTDGNEKSVENVEKILENNYEAFGDTSVSCKILRWDNSEDYDELKNSFDLILCADCLFFTEICQELCNTLFDLLRSNGIVLIFAPNRGDTFSEFFYIAKNKFHVEYLENYDEIVTELHLENLSKGTDTYDADIHYPLMMKLRKQ